ncbi:protein of unknown function DUF1704 [Magnetococcus marinus MC-1]|uniref:Flavohemoglobin expression-modulating QEGLA motif protein n=1 Tax=Magnetococcus marinus (strain ATCC BAA-1437 / JCM 17883 / MC-1) TaxID=156889 RepID=A0LC82_MAGMM|nr:flavohemoglobin expression-modulating QEGLA motif protein [Magnetococcus marinus]ABK45575.1 protein of unknown function DUF1704 [Magnetococcus marinus MC-1]
MKKKQPPALLNPTEQPNRLAEGRVDICLKQDGRLYLERPLPFLILYRIPHRPDPGTRYLLEGEAAFMVVGHQRGCGVEARGWFRQVVARSVARFGAILVLEVWAQSHGEVDEKGLPRTKVEIVSSAATARSPFVATLERRLATMAIKGRKFQTQLKVKKGVVHTPNFPALEVDEACQDKVYRLGLALPPVYQMFEQDIAYMAAPQMVRQLRRALGYAIRQTVFRFSMDETSVRFPHFHRLGPRRWSKTALWVDRQLAGLSEHVDYLYQVTPTNTPQAMRQFNKEGCSTTPVFQYRPVPFDLAVMKRALFAIPIEKVNDPALAYLLREKQEELDRMISLLVDVDTPRFVHGSVQLFGAPSAKTIQMARQILAARALPERESRGLPVQTVVEHVEACFAYYHAKNAGFKGRVKRVDDLPAGLMVSGDELFVGSDTRIPAWRLEALINHEVGVHVLTNYNGRQQPMRLLSVGLAGYEAFQEGLAVLSEYLAGGLTQARVRTLAARVVAVEGMLQGERFAQVYTDLVEQYGFNKQQAFLITMRVFRGGGLTKDALYLPGFLAVVKHVQEKGLDELFWVGKMGLEHLPMIRELRWRGMLHGAALLPHFLEKPQVQERLALLQEQGWSLENWLDKEWM